MTQTLFGPDAADESVKSMGMSGPVPSTPARPEVGPGPGRRPRVWTSAGYGVALVVAATVMMSAAPRSSWWWVYGLVCEVVGGVAVVVALVRWRRARFDSMVRAIALGPQRGGAGTIAPQRKGARSGAPAVVETPGSATVRARCSDRVGQVVSGRLRRARTGRVTQAGSGAAPNRARSAGLAGLRVSQFRIIRSEWTKFHSLRSSRIVLLLTALVVVGVAALVAGVITAQWDKLNPGARKQFNPALAPLSGIGFAGLAVGVLGVLMISGEYATGMIRSSLTAVPRRLRFLLGKLAVLTGAVGVAGLASTLSAFYVAQAMLSRKHLGVTLAAPHARYFVVAAAAYLVLVAVIGMALGGMLRHSAAAISSLFALFLILPIVVNFLPAPLASRVGPLLPAAAGQAFWTHGTAPNGTAGSPWPGLAIMIGWAAGLFVISAMRLVNEDA